MVEPPAHNYDTAYRNLRGEVLQERPVKDWDDATVDGWNAATMEHPLGSCDHACALRGSQCSDATMAALDFGLTVRAAESRERFAKVH